ncbi:sugar ABC transporter substrate-binding protein [Clostridium oryzae]|uniref:Maltodextrin-binding protein n=1 Tax=Clostridium oryzae TaxID=1450648 RepID=A0A1V4IKH2_9CLOT|nr:extracellular solute-binding protein [Clostridium oryzae]OPJ60324.1 maltose/maltodextrin-binding protein precursor [Clostridium oryzae]
MSKKFLSLLLAGSLITTVFAGCGSQGANASKTKKSNEQVTIKVWHMLEPKVVDTIKEAFKDFEDKNPNIKVDFQRQENLGDKVTMIGNSKNDVDLVAAPHDWVGKYAAMGVMSDITDKIDKKVFDEIIPSAVDAVKYKGKVYGVPSTVETVTLLYNKDMLPNPPKTTDELLQIAKTMTKDGKYGFLTVPNDVYFNSAWIYGFGGKILDDQGNSVLNSEGTIEAYKFLQELAQYYPKNLDAGMVNDLFKNKKAAAIVAGPWSIKDIKAAGVNYGIATLPVISKNNQKPTPYMTVQTMMLCKNSKHKDAAIKVMEFFAGSKVGEALAKSAGSIPANTRAYDSQEVKSNAEVMGYMEQVKTAIAMPNIPQMAAVWEPVKNSLTNSVVLKGDPKSAIEKADKKIQEDIKNMK